ILLIVILLAILGAIAGMLWSGRLGRQPDNRLSLSGNIELTQVDISFKVPGKLVELNVKEGSTVKKGDVIARIDRAQVEQQRTRDEAGVLAAQSQYQQMLTAIQWQRATVDSDIALRKADIRAAQAKLAELLAGARPQEIQQARAS